MLLGAASCALWGRLVLLGDLRGGNLGEALSISLIQGLILLGAMLSLRGLRCRDAGGFDWLLIIAPALLARALMLGQLPSLSDDIYRYVWEGRMVLEGVNPYLHPPADPNLAGFRDALWLPINHKDIPAIYPPTMQLLFAGLAALGARLLGFKAALVAFELAGAGLMLRRLVARNGRLALAALLLWHPLAITEVAGQGHFEPVPLLFTLLAIEAWERRASARSYAWLGVATAAKYLPVALGLSLLRREGWRGVWAGPLVVAVLFAPFAAPGLFEALTTYGEAWRFNDGGFWLLNEVLDDSEVTTWACRAILPRLRALPPGDPAMDMGLRLVPTKMLVAAALGLGLAVAAWRGAHPRRVAFGLFAALPLVSPVVHPWYLLWMLPFLADFPRPSLLTLSLLVPLSYEVLLRYDGSPETWVQEPVVKLVIYGAWWLVAALEVWSWLWNSRRRRA